VRCPEAGHHYTNYKSMGLENVEPENNLDQPAGAESSTRKPDSCLECDHLTGSNVCGLKQWKTFPTLCHAMFCGKNKDEHIDDRGDCELLVCHSCWAFLLPRLCLPTATQPYTRKISQLVNKTRSHCLFPVVDMSETSCFHLVTRLMSPTDSHATSCSTKLISSACNKLLTS
jgi:hypothetical protein